MVTPISNDNISPQLSERSQVSGNGRAERSGTDAQAPEANSAPQVETRDDTVSLSPASEARNQLAVERSNGGIENAAQAAALAQRIREQVEEAGTRALQAYGRVSAEQTTGLLSPTPA